MKFTKPVKVRIIGLNGIKTSTRQIEIPFIEARKDITWLGADCIKFPLKDMEEKHIKNVINYLNHPYNTSIWTTNVFYNGFTHFKWKQIFAAELKFRRLRKRYNDKLIELESIEKSLNKFFEVK